MCGPEDPLFTPLLPLARVPFQAKESVHKTPFWENLEILASTASIFTQISAHKPPNLEIFSSQAPKFGNFPLTSPPFQRQMSVRKPHTSEIQAAHPYRKKSWVPPPPGLAIPWWLNLKKNQKKSLYRNMAASIFGNKFIIMDAVSNCHCTGRVKPNNS